MADTTFYSTVAGVIPVLLLTMAVDRGGFLRPMPRRDIDRLVGERRSVRALTKASNDLGAAFEQLAAKSAAAKPDEELSEQLETLRDFPEAIKEQLAEGLQESNRLSVSCMGLAAVVLLSIAEAAAIKTCLSHRPTDAGRLLTEIGLLVGAGLLLFSLIDPEVRKIGDLKGWQLETSQLVARAIAVGLAVALVGAWQLI